MVWDTAMTTDHNLRYLRGTTTGLSTYSGDDYDDDLCLTAI